MTLPNFIIGGVPRGGTTSLATYLREHPQVYFSPVKEPRYFLLEADDPHPDPNALPLITIGTMAEYEALFDGVTHEKAIGEATPFYLHSPIARSRIRETLPDVRMIFTLRDPVARAYSGYMHSYRLADDAPTLPELFADLDHPLITGGRYYHSLAAWFDTFPPAQIRVITTEDLQQDAAGVYRNLCRFLEIDDSFAPDFAVRNRSGVPKSAALAGALRGFGTGPLARGLKPYLPSGMRRLFNRARDSNLQKAPPLDPALAAELRAYYLDDIEKLEGLLDRDLSAWKG